MPARSEAGARGSGSTEGSPPCTSDSTKGLASPRRERCLAKPSVGRGCRARCGEWRSSGAYPDIGELELEGFGDPKSRAVHLKWRS